MALKPVFNTLPQVWSQHFIGVPLTICQLPERLSRSTTPNTRLIRLREKLLKFFLEFGRLQRIRQLFVSVKVHAVSDGYQPTAHSPF